MSQRMKSEDYVVPDVVDDEELAQNAYEELCDQAVNKVRSDAAKIEAGAAGHCDFCGSFFPRVVQRLTRRGEEVKACGRCRDENKLG